jgi:hypothetical protein
LWSLVVDVDDSWAVAESAFAAFLREHPATERALLDSPLESLNGADAYLRATVLEERGQDAAAAYRAADEKCYSAEFRAARDDALERVVELAQRRDDLLVDVATGRGGLLTRLVAGTSRPLVATDVSPHVLRATERRLPGPRYVVADACSLPFDDGEAGTLVTHVGLANVPGGRRLLRELRRVGHELIATHVFYPANDQANRTAARELGLEELLVRETALPAFAAAGWKVAVEYEREMKAEPTPASALIPELRIDGLPVAATRITWCVLRAT